MANDLPESDVEHRNYAIAYCPECGAEHEVSTCGHGEKTCDCMTTFYWNTED